MAGRRTHQRFDESLSHEASAVAEYATKKCWRFGRRNLLVEGTIDVAYFELASSHFQRHHGLCLLDEQFRVIAAGLHDDGGVRGVVREMLNLNGLAYKDEALPKSARIRMLPVFDDDDAGRRCFKKLIDPDIQFRAYQDVFLLHRAYPKLNLGSGGYHNAVKEANREWEGLDCEIEDLLGRDLLEAFCEDCPGALKVSPSHRGPAHHYDFHGNCKRDLLRFTQQIAELSDVLCLVRTLQYFRGLFGLPTGPQV